MEATPAANRKSAIDNRKFAGVSGDVDENKGGAENLSVRRGVANTIIPATRAKLQPPEITRPARLVEERSAPASHDVYENRVS